MKDLNQLAKDFKVMSDKYNKLNHDLPKIAGVEAVKQQKKNFAAQGFIEDGSNPAESWERRKAQTDYAYDNYKGYKGKNYSSSNPILRQTGNLRDSIHYKVEGEHSVFIGSNISLVPQAQAINEGLGNQPKRKFLGMSKELAKLIKEKIHKEREKIFKTYFTSKGK